MFLVIHTDGGSRGNPGPAASAFTVHDKDNNLLYEEKKYIGVTTNNVAEYTALRMAWDWIVQNDMGLDISEVDFILDSELVVKQMKGEYKIKDNTLLSIATTIKKMETSQKFIVNYRHTLRSNNSQADSLVNAALDSEITQ